jgi:hypothetical protein
MFQLKFQIKLLLLKKSRNNIYILLKQLGKNTKLVPIIYLIYNLLHVVSKRTQKSLWYVKKII